MMRNYLKRGMEALALMALTEWYSHPPMQASLLKLMEATVKSPEKERRPNEDKIENEGSC